MSYLFVEGVLRSRQGGDLLTYGREFLVVLCPGTMNTNSKFKYILSGKLL